MFLFFFLPPPVQDGTPVNIELAFWDDEDPEWRPVCTNYDRWYSPLVVNFNCVVFLPQAYEDVAVTAGTTDEYRLLPVNALAWA